MSTVKDYFKSWLEAKRPETADSTFDFYSQTANSFLAHLGDRTNLDIGVITRNDVLTFRNTLALRLAAKTVNHRIKTVRMIFKAASRDSLITQNPAEHVETVKKRNIVFPFLSNFSGNILEILFFRSARILGMKLFLHGF